MPPLTRPPVEGGRTEMCTVGVRDVVPPPPRPYYVGEEEFAR